jgi:hypothetical protein
MPENYPSSPVPQYSFTEEIGFKTLISQFENGTEQRRNKWSRGKRQFTLVYNVLEIAEIEILWDFYVARKGSFESFYFTDLNLITGGINVIDVTPTNGGTGYTAGDYLTVISGDGNGIVRVDTVGSGIITGMYPTTNITAGTGYKVGTGKVTSGGTGAGATINITTIINNIYTVRFLEDSMSYEMFTLNLTKTGLKFIQVI